MAEPICANRMICSVRSLSTIGGMNSGLVYLIYVKSGINGKTDHSERIYYKIHAE